MGTKLITELELKEHFVKKQLLRHGVAHQDLEGLTYDELKYKLAKMRATEVDIEAEANRYF